MADIIGIYIIGVGSSPTSVTTPCFFLIYIFGAILFFFYGVFFSIQIEAKVYIYNMSTSDTALQEQSSNNIISSVQYLSNKKKSYYVVCLPYGRLQLFLII